MPMNGKCLWCSRVIIFDFDLTLVDTSPIAHLREKKQWNAVMAKLSELKVYDGIN